MHKSDTAASSATSPTDRRVMRTRKMLFDSFEQLLHEQRSINRITISRIAERADVNRVTVYAHFTDKQDLISQWKREKFRQRLFDVTAGGSGHDVSFVKIIETVISFMVGYKSYFKILNKEYEPLFEAAIQHEMSQIIYKKIVQDGQLTQDKALITATFVSAAIFGTAHEWAARNGDVSEAYLARQILEYVELILSRPTA